MARAKQTTVVVKSTTRTRKSSSSPTKSTSSNSGRVTNPRCPSCGRFMNKS